MIKTQRKHPSDTSQYQLIAKTTIEIAEILNFSCMAP